MMMPDVLSKTPQPTTAWEVWKRTSDKIMSDFQFHDKFGYRKSLNAYIKAFSKSGATKNEIRDIFDQEVIKAVRAGNHTDPIVKAHADHLRGIFAQLLDIAKKHDVPGFTQLEHNPNYFTTIYSPTKIHEAVALHGEDNVVRLFAEAMRDSWNFTDEKDLMDVAKGVLRITKNLDQHPLSQVSAAFAAPGPEAMVDVLKASGVMDEKTIERVLKNIEKSKPNAESRIPFGKRAIPFDRSKTIQTEFGTLGFTDLTETNLEHIMATYVNSVVGESVAQETYRAMSLVLDPKGKFHARSFGELKERLTQAEFNHQKNVLGRSQQTATRKAQRAVKVLEQMDKAMRGRSQIVDHQFRETARRLNMAVGPLHNGTFGLANIADFGTLIGAGGIRTTLSNIPELSRLAVKIAKGQISREDLDSLIAIAEAYEPSARFNSQPIAEDVGAGRVDRLLFGANRVSNILNGMRAVDMTAKIATVLNMEKIWVRMAEDGVLPNARRLTSLGLDKPMAERILNEIKAPYGTREYTNIAGGKSKKIITSQWKDQQAASSFVTAVDRWSRTTVLRGTPADFAPWMTNNEFGKIITKFRVFSFLANDRGLAHIIQVRDKTAANAMLGGLFGGLAAYLATVHIDSLGKEDPEQYRKEKLSTDRLIAGTIRRTGWTGMFPDMFDSFAGKNAFFNNRLSGFSSGFVSIDSSAVLSDTRTLLKFPSAIFESVQQGHIGKSQYRTFTNLMPFRRLYFVKQIVDRMGDDLPENR